jgi:oligoribonuclease NrnB/cAMP/cGMP phosphodiesterase (DHH superfamily)
MDPKIAWTHPCIGTGEAFDLSKAHLFTHAGCMDGSASAILFCHAGGSMDRVHWVPAGHVEQFMFDYSHMLQTTDTPVLLVDIAPTDIPFAKFLADRGNSYIIDHHASNLQLNGLHPDFFVDPTNAACGSENFRQWLVKKGHLKFRQDHFVRFCTLVDDHDRWIRKYPFSLEMPKFFSFVGQPDFVKRFMNVAERFRYERNSYWNEFEQDLMQLVNRVQNERYENLMDKFQVLHRNFCGKMVKVGYIITDEVNNSELLHKYLVEHPDVDVSCQISYGLQKVAMRSNDRVDVGAWCKQYGGGGHKNAAGHPLPKGQIFDIIRGMHA